jgi:hypothetical protein
MTKNMTPARAKVLAAATRDIRKSGLPGPMPEMASSAPPILARSDSPARWWRISIHVPRTRKATKTKRKLTLKVTAEAATSMKKESKPASRRSLRERRRKRRSRMRKRSTCTMPSSRFWAR